MAYRKKIAAALSAVVISVVLMGGCGRENGVRRGAGHHTMDDVVAALESAGYRIDWRTSEMGSVEDEESVAGMMEAIRVHFAAEDYDRLGLNDEVVEVFVFDLSDGNARGNMDRAAEDAGRRRRKWRHDNLLYCIWGHPDAEGIQRAIEGL